MNLITQIQTNLFSLAGWISALLITLFLVGVFSLYVFVQVRVLNNDLEIGTDYSAPSKRK
jgi:hypothetical protein